MTDKPDTQAVIPPPPASFTATPVANSSQIKLSWSAVTGAVGYVIERFTQLGTQTGTTFTDTLPANTTHTYRVRAKDSAGDLGDYSNTATITSGSGTPPVGGSPPVVTAGHFSVKLPVTSGQIIGTMTATNNPTSWKFV
jgi:hypothetical protein